MALDMQSWEDVKNFVKHQFTNEVLFYSEEDGYSIEWHRDGLYCLRIWPPEKGKILIEFDAVSRNIYHQWHIPLKDLISDFKDVIDSVLLSYQLK